MKKYWDVQLISVLVHLLLLFIFLDLVLLLLSHVDGPQGSNHVLIKDFFELFLDHLLFMLQSLLTYEKLTSSFGSTGGSQALFGGCGKKDGNI